MLLWGTTGGTPPCSLRLLDPGYIQAASSVHSSLAKLKQSSQALLGWTSHIHLMLMLSIYTRLAQRGRGFRLLCFIDRIRTSVWGPPAQLLQLTHPGHPRELW